MNWFILALLAPLAWSVANYLDKYILSRSEGGEGGSGGLMILSSIFSALFALCLIFVTGTSALSIGSQSIGALLLSGMIEASYLLFYFLALEGESTATVVALMQFSPIFGLIFAYLMLSEIPDKTQIFAVVLILIGTLFIVIKKKHGLQVKNKILILMGGSMALVGLYNTIFKIAGEHQSFLVAVFWQYIGIVLVGLILFISFPNYRKQLINMLARRGKKVLALTGLAEIMNIVALLATNAAILLAPVALVLSIGSIQPLFVFVEGFLVVYFLPKFFDVSEKPSFKVQYVAGIILVCLGGFLIY